MAGHGRTIETGKARRTARGRSRRIRQHIPDGEAEQAKRRKQHSGARANAVNRINRTTDPLRKLDIAREYLRSAAAKYQPDSEITDAVQALLAAGDRIYQHAEPLSPAAKRTRRVRAERSQTVRANNAALIREGKAAVRQQQNNARNAQRQRRR